MDATDIEVRLTLVTSEQWAELWTLGDEITALEKPGEWHGGAVTGHTANGHKMSSMPYISYARPVSRFMELWYEMNLVVPFIEFPCGPEDGVEHVAWVASAPVEEVVRLASKILRGDRFSEGYLGHAVETGAVGAIIERMRVSLTQP